MIQRVAQVARNLGRSQEAIRERTLVVRAEDRQSRSTRWRLRRRSASAPIKPVEQAPASGAVASCSAQVAQQPELPADELGALEPAGNSSRLDIDAGAILSDRAATHWQDTTPQGGFFRERWLQLRIVSVNQSQVSTAMHNALTLLVVLALAEEMPHAVPAVIPYGKPKAAASFAEAVRGSKISPADARLLLASYLNEVHGPTDGAMFVRAYSDLQCIYNDEYVFGHSKSWQKRHGVMLLGYRVNRNTGRVRRVQVQDLKTESEHLFPYYYVPYRDQYKFMPKSEMEAAHGDD